MQIKILSVVIGAIFCASLSIHTSVAHADKIEFEVDRAYSTDRLRIEGHGGLKDRFLIQIDTEGKTAKVFLQAAALQKNRFPSPEEAPWLHLEFFDKDNKRLFQKRNVFVVTVDECGGYEDHVVTFPLVASEKDFEKIGSVKASLGGTNAITC